MLINEDKLCVLRLNASNTNISLEYVPIETPLKEELEEVYLRIDNDNISRRDIFDYIKNHSTLKVLFKSYNFCFELNSSFGEQLYIKEIERKFKGKFSKRALIRICQEQALAYSLEQAYRYCENNSNILAYSHRRRGWSYRPYQLNENFSIQFLTNFGYGMSSYFYTRLKYKNIEIVPISEWVHYRYAKLSEIICASAVHSLDNESWIQAMEYGQKAYNLFMSSENDFVNQYLKQECEKLINGLSYIKSNSKFELRKNIDRFNPVFEVVEMSNSELIAFRGEKISGSLYFIENIKSLEDILTIANYISEIENFNREIKPILQREFKRITDLLIKLEVQLSSLKTIYEKLKEKNSEYDKIKSELKEELKSNVEYNEKSNFEKQDLIKEIFLEKYPEYEDFQKELNISKDKYYKLDSKIHMMKNDQNSIETSSNKIETYFNNTSN